ncbi:MAG: hypothetical protein CMF50_03650 [Legionellales bacterium]|nr:hypothetical protein [Legionellales bacterium]|tara:strand:- start:4051 stop:7395 length:3345 start_codon:yes stop_codon:yes gene_type:complete
MGKTNCNGKRPREDDKGRKELKRIKTSDSEAGEQPDALTLTGLFDYYTNLTEQWGIQRESWLEQHYAPLSRDEQAVFTFPDEFINCYKRSLDKIIDCCQKILVVVPTITDQLEHYMAKKLRHSYFASRGIKAALEGNNQNAVKYFKNALGSDSSIQLTTHWLMSCYLILGQYQKLIDVYNNCRGEFGNVREMMEYQLALFEQDPFIAWHRNTMPVDAPKNHIHFVAFLTGGFTAPVQAALMRNTYTYSEIFVLYTLAKIYLELHVDDSDRVFARYYRAREAASAGFHEYAIRLYDDALRLAPMSIRIKIARIQSLLACSGENSLVNLLHPISQEISESIRNGMQQLDSDSREKSDRVLSSLIRDINHYLQVVKFCLAINDTTHAEYFLSELKQHHLEIRLRQAVLSHTSDMHQQCSQVLSAIATYIACIDVIINSKKPLVSWQILRFSFDTILTDLIEQNYSIDILDHTLRYCLDKALASFGLCLSEGVWHNSQRQQALQYFINKIRPLIANAVALEPKTHEDEPPTIVFANPSQGRAYLTMLTVCVSSLVPLIAKPSNNMELTSLISEATRFVKYCLEKARLVKQSNPRDIYGYSTSVDHIELLCKKVGVTDDNVVDYLASGKRLYAEEWPNIKNPSLWTDKKVESCYFSTQNVAIRTITQPNVSLWPTLCTTALKLETRLFLTHVKLSVMAHANELSLSDILEIEHVWHSHQAIIQKYISLLAESHNIQQNEAHLTVINKIKQQHYPFLTQSLLRYLSMILDSNDALSHLPEARIINRIITEIMAEIAGLTFAGPSHIPHPHTQLNDLYSPLKRRFEDLQDKDYVLKQQPLAVTCRKKQFVVPFPTEQLISTMLEAQKRREVRDSANLSAQCITLVYSYKNTGETRALSLPMNCSDETVTVDNLGINWREWQHNILNRIKHGYQQRDQAADNSELITLAKNLQILTSPAPDQYNNQQHKHSEQAFFVWLAQQGPERLFALFKTNDPLLNDPENIKISAVLFDIASSRSSCEACQASALAVQGAEGDFTDKLQQFLSHAGYTLPKSNKLYSATRVLANTPHWSTPVSNPETRSVRALKNIGFFQYVNPGVFCSGGQQNLSATSATSYLSLTKR